MKTLVDKLCNKEDRVRTGVPQGAVLLLPYLFRDLKGKKKILFMDGSFRSWARFAAKIASFTLKKEIFKRTNAC